MPDISYTKLVGIYSVASGIIDHSLPVNIKSALACEL